MSGLTESDLKELSDALDAFEKRCVERLERHRTFFDALERKRVEDKRKEQAALEAKTLLNKPPLTKARPKLASKEQLDQWAFRREQKELDKIPSLSW